MTNEQFKDYLIESMVVKDPQVVECYNQNKEIINEICGLTEWRLLKDLKEALKLQHGYFKNQKGEYRYLKGIEVTNDTGNLCRMGYNGEDRGVWVHYCELDNRSVSYHNTPVSNFIYWMTNSVGKKSRFFPTTKEDFDQQVQKTVQNIISDYHEKRNPKEYYDFMTKWNKLTAKVRKKYKENEALLQDYMNNLISKEKSILSQALGIPISECRSTD